MRRLPTFQDYTVDVRLREFRTVGEWGIESIPFDSPRGTELLAKMREAGQDRFIGTWTIGMMQETQETREAVEREFTRLAKLTSDWFYVIRVKGKKFFVADNGECGYTAMLPDEY